MIQQPAPISFSEAERLSLIFDAENRHEWQNTAHILDVLALTPDMVVADVGAGTGYFSSLFAERLTAGRVHALDAEPNMVGYMGKRFAEEGHNNIRIALSRHEDPCLPGGLDLVFLANVYRFIRERSVFLANLHRQIDEQTRVVFVDFKGSRVRVTPQQAVEEVLAAGFHIEAMDVTGCPDHYILQFRKDPVAA